MARERATRLKEHVGARISEIRRGKGWAQEQLAVRLGVTAQWISRLERGVENSTLETLAAVAKALNVKVVELFGELEANPELPAKASRRNASRARRS